MLGEPPVLQQAYNQSSLVAEVLCKIETSYWFPLAISPLLLMIMAYERYKAVVHPLSRRDGNVGKARLKWLLPLVWVMGASIVMAYIPFVEYDANMKLCNFFVEKYSVYLNVLNATWCIMQIIIPSIAMLMFYGRVICTLRKQGASALGLQAVAERARRKARKKVISTVIAVTLAFYFLCGAPQVLCVIDMKINRIFKFMDDLKLLLLAINSVFNPLLYFIFMQSFRNGFRRVFNSTSRNNSVPSRIKHLSCTSNSS